MRTAWSQSLPLKPLIRASSEAAMLQAVLSVTCDTRFSATMSLRVDPENLEKVDKET